MSYPTYQVPAGDVLPVMFTSYAGATGASVTLTGLAVTDIEIYKDGSVTQRASDAGYTLLDTDGIDFDAITGIHGFSIDTGDNTDAGFYTVGAWFTVVVSAVTIDAQTVNFIACQFRLMAAEGVAGMPKVDLAAMRGVEQSATDLTDFADAGYDPATNKVQGVVLTDTVTTLTGHTAQTGDSFARLGAPAGASVSADILAIDNFVDGIESTLTLVAIADAVWDEAIAGHLTAGTTGAALNAAGSAGDPWSTAIPGAYGAGTAGKILGDNINATISSRASQTSLDTVDDFLDTEVAAIKAKTDLIPAAPAAVGDIPTAIQNADTLLDRNMATGTDSGSPTVRTVRQALRFLRNKWSISAGTLTVTKEDDTTASFTATVTTDAAAVPIIGNDPA